MGNWIETLINKIGDTWPFVKVEPWEGGVIIYYVPWEIRFRGLRPYIEPSHTRTRVVGPGVYFLPWYYGEIKKEAIVPQVLDLLSQTVVLRDGTVVSFSVNIEYEVNDVRKNLLDVYAPESSLEAASRIHLAQRVREMETMSELIANQKKLEDSLSGTLTTRAKRWGIKINSVGFTDLMPSKAWRLLGDSPFAHH